MNLIGGDFFCGAGGFSEGARQAVEEMGHTFTDWLAINHWPRAIETHTKNHQWARHMCVRLEQVRPETMFPGQRMNLLLASPECTHHSVARGGKPMSDQSRAGAWNIVDWVNRIHIETLLIENVREFRDWGPLGTNGRPLKSKKGQTYKSFLNALRAAGYTVEDRLLNAADFGDPTTRIRLFIQAQRRRPIRWPQPSHFQGENLIGLKRWRAAREIINWELKGSSIFTRKKPLSDKTLARIEAGLRKFAFRDFVVEWDHQGGNGSGVRDASSPMSTVTTKARHGLVQAQAFLLPRNSDGMRTGSVDKPLHTICTESRGEGLCESFLIPHFGERKGQKPRVFSLRRPLPAVTGQGAGSLCETFLVELHGTAKSQIPSTAKNINHPLPPVKAAGHHAVVESFLVETAHQGKRKARSIKDPLPSVAGNRGDMAVIEPMLLGQQSCAAARSVDEPSPTVATAGAVALVKPFLTEYYGNGGARNVDDPLGTATTKQRFGLAQPLLKIDGKLFKLDILFRMLQPRELASAQGFPVDYYFAGNKTETVKQIGNAVPVNLAKALVKAALGGEA